MTFKNFFLIVALSFSIVISGQEEQQILDALDAKAAMYGEIAHEIWEWAEMGYLEVKSAGLLQKTLSDEGFTIKAGVAGIPTAFIAEYGSGYPVIAILGEYDALPGISQEAIAEKKSAGGAAGHACGHHLFGTASSAAAIAARKWLEDTGSSGTYNECKFYDVDA